jgi:hypothetical protein
MQKNRGTLRRRGFARKEKELLARCFLGCRAAARNRSEDRPAHETAVGSDLLRIKTGQLHRSLLALTVRRAQKCERPGDSECRTRFRDRQGELPQDFL